MKVYLYLDEELAFSMPRTTNSNALLPKTHWEWINEHGGIGDEVTCAYCQDVSVTDLRQDWLKLQ